MDRVGTYLCLATIPMALLTIAGIAAGLGLLVIGDWPAVLFGLFAFTGCWLLAPMLERLVVTLDSAAATALASGRRRARLVAGASGALPTLVILSWEYLCYVRFNAGTDGVHALLRWLWSYGVATGPWTLYATHVSRFRRTLVGIRAYAGHLAYWLLSFAALILGVAPALAAPLMLLPAILPLVVGTLLAIADREALTNVRV